MTFRRLLALLLLVLAMVWGGFFSTPDSGRRVFGEEVGQPRLDTWQARSTGAGADFPENACMPPPIMVSSDR